MWHRGKPTDEALAANPHLGFKRLLSYSPKLNVIERFGKLLRRRATHNRLFDTLADLKRPLRASLCDFQTMRQRSRRSHQEFSSRAWQATSYRRRRFRTHDWPESGSRILKGPPRGRGRVVGAY
jgi:hypothetical protein